MSFKCKSFCLGILVTSITWAVILYLYNTLNTTNTHQNVHHFEGLSVERPREKQINNYLSNDEDNDIPNNLHLSEKKDIELKNHRRKWPVKINMPEIKEGEIHNYKKNIEDIGLVRSPDDQKVRDDGNRQHSFNLLVSNRLSFHRAVPDTRNPMCKSLNYSGVLPRASIVICFYNEAKSALLRTIHSVFDRTPDYLIEEIILVDDFSELDELKTPLKDYLTEKFLDRVKLIHTTKREGLIRARMFGAKHTKGEVLVFLDSHCEVNKMWLEPLLSEISKDRSIVVCPIIDIINADTFLYTSSPIVRGGFNWGLHFKWDSLPPNALATKADFVKPFRSPTMAGGLFAIDRSYFFEIGEYDSGMDTWGGENLEISFRVWMCGGSLYIVPCSRVGHIFRQRRPYGSPTGKDTVMYNSLRVAHVWMDEYKENYFKMRPDARQQFYGNVTDRIELRKQLNCKSFDWYLKNIYPELKPPNPRFSKSKMMVLKNKQMKKAIAIDPMRKKNKPKLIKKYQIHLRKTDLCVESDKDVTIKGSLLILRRCRKAKNQMWFESTKDELILAELLCMDAGEEYPRLAKCHEMGSSQSWRHKTLLDTQLYNMAAGTCLGVKSPTEGAYLSMEFCTQLEPTKWDLLEPAV
uniref:Polypeptide N-acetylgalactosaminyltransferase n=1 Tax=Strigamia maritima TaxID=126957 RepID=T1JAX5_STRMM